MALHKRQASTDMDVDIPAPKKSNTDIESSMVKNDRMIFH